MEKKKVMENKNKFKKIKEHRIFITCDINMKREVKKKEK